MGEAPSRYVEGAVIAGEAAEVLDGLLSSRQVAEMLAKMAEKHPQMRAGLEAMRRAVRQAAIGHAVRRAAGGSGLGSAETQVAEIGPPSPHEIGTPEAAALLGVSERRVRQLAAGGMGRRVGGRWLLDRGLVMAYGQRRRVA